MNQHLRSHQYYTLNDLSSIGFSRTQGRRLLDALTGMGTTHISQTGGGERRIAPMLFEAIQQVHAQLRPTRVSTDFVQAVLRAVDAPRAVPAAPQQDIWDTALNLAVYVGDTRLRLIGLWEMLESHGQVNGIQIPDWHQSFYTEYSNALR
jgi:hypothetical protein